MVRDRLFLRRLALAPAPSSAAAALLIAVLHGCYVLWSGVTFAPDSQSYAYWSERLVASGFDYATVLGEAEANFPPILYVMFVTVVAGLRLLSGEHWPVALVALNFAAHLALGLLVVRLAVRVTGRGTAGWVALFLFLGSYDLANWVAFIMSDASFVLIAFAVFTLAAARILGDSRGWWPVVLPAAVGIFYRPTGMVLLPDLAWAAWLARRQRPLLSRRAGLVGLCLAATAAALLFGWLMQDPGRWPFASLAPVFDSVAGGYAIGEVVGGRPETHLPPPHALADFVLISFSRFVWFFAPGAASFSLAHWLVSLAFFVPCYALAGWLLVALWRGDDRFGERERNVFLAAAGAVFAYALFHALVQVDFDWRYRVPVLPHLILLAAGGAADLVRRVAPA